MLHHSIPSLFLYAFGTLGCKVELAQSSFINHARETGMNSSKSVISEFVDILSGTEFGSRLYKR